MAIVAILHNDGYQRLVVVHAYNLQRSCFRWLAQANPVPDLKLKYPNWHKHSRSPDSDWYLHDDACRAGNGTHTSQALAKAVGVQGHVQWWYPHALKWSVRRQPFWGHTIYGRPQYLKMGNLPAISNYSPSIRVWGLHRIPLWFTRFIVFKFSTRLTVSGFPGDKRSTFGRNSWTSWGQQQSRTLHMDVEIILSFSGRSLVATSPR